MQPSTTSQINKIIEVEMYNIYSVNKVLLQQILEIIRQITKKILDKNPQQIMKLKPMILELYRQKPKKIQKLDRSLSNQKFDC